MDKNDDLKPSSQFAINVSDWDQSSSETTSLLDGGKCHDTVTSSSTRGVGGGSINSDNEEEKEIVEPKSSLFWATFNLTNDIVGVGLLAAPHYMSQGGLPFVCAFIVFIAVISDYTLRKLNHTSVTFRQPNFVELCGFAYGKVGYLFACLFMFIYNFGAAVANLLVIGSAVPQLLSLIIKGEHIFLHREFILVVAVLLFLPVSFFKNVKDYAVCSMITVAGVATVVITVALRQYLPPLLPILVQPEHAFQIVKPSFIEVLGGISFIFVCHDFSISISSSLEHPTPSRWARVVRASLAIGFVSTLIIGLGGYFTFWDQVEPNILDNFANNDKLASFARSVICLGIIASVPYNVVMPRLAIRQAIELAWKPTAKQDTIFHVIVTIVVLSGELLVAISITNLGSLFEFVGGFASAGLAFILPPLVYIKLEKGTWNSPHKLLMIAITIFGFFTLISSCVITLLKTM